MYAYVHTPVGACVGTREENQFFYHTLPYSLETRSLRKPEDNTLTRMPGREVPVISLSPPANTGFIACASLPDFYMVAENSNTIPHAGTASPLAHLWVWKIQVYLSYITCSLQNLLKIFLRCWWTSWSDIGNDSGMYFFICACGERWKIPPHRW